MLDYMKKKKLNLDELQVCSGGIIFNGIPNRDKYAIINEKGEIEIFKDYERALKRDEEVRKIKEQNLFEIFLKQVDAKLKRSDTSLKEHKN